MFPCKKKKQQSHTKCNYLCLCFRSDQCIFLLSLSLLREYSRDFITCIYIASMWATACLYPFLEGFTASHAILLWHVISHTLYRHPIMTQHQKQPLSIPTLSIGLSALPSVHLSLRVAASLSLTPALFL